LALSNQLAFDDFKFISSPVSLGNQFPEIDVRKFASNFDILHGLGKGEELLTPPLPS